MTDLLTDALPTVWHGQAIDPDFRHMVWLNNAYRRGKVEKYPFDIARAAIERFYPQASRFMTDAQAFSNAYQWLIEFYMAGEQLGSEHPPQEPDRPATLPFDYHCDAPYIIAGFQRLYGIDLTTERLHWFHFRALLRGIIGEDCMFSRIIDWRTADISEKSPEDRRYYEKQREHFALPAELRGGAAVAETVDEHNRAFLARFRSR